MYHVILLVTAFLLFISNVHSSQTSVDVESLKDYNAGFGSTTGKNTLKVFTQLDLLSFKECLEDGSPVSYEIVPSLCGDFIRDYTIFADNTEQTREVA